MFLLSLGLYTISLTSLSLSTMCYRPYYNRVSKLPSIVGKVIFIQIKKAPELISVPLMFTFKSSSGALFLLPAPAIA